ncbi:MAG: DUF4342 domain-containing protein [Candidatus Bipolaricaulis sp.]|nr:DUF4342 domain-containing protein [Candidatus Bipolaricaulis sp.]MDD5219109.1 DUF4342 domain-containing protein [Candidatus Bipolaricaulis sp.]MDD5647056.1 DUF4342 domain-containing protein [Candidatus Bipolaricaulis sp.]
MAQAPRTEELKVTGEELLATVRELLRQGNIRRIAVKNREGKVLIEIPLTLGVVGTLLIPTLAALGAVAALVAECSIVIERIED